MGEYFLFNSYLHESKIFCSHLEIDLEKSVILKGYSRAQLSQS